MKRNKILAFFSTIACLLCTLCLVACGGDNANSGNDADNGSGENGNEHIGHNYATTVIPPTCVEQGYTLHKCVCGDEYKDNYIDATGIHSFVTYIYNNDATCVDYGTETATCENCTETDTRVKGDTVVGEHNYVDYVCDICATIDPNAPVTDDLYYYETTVGEITGYGVSAGGIDDEIYVKIPATHNDKPVLRVSNFGECKTIKSVEIPYGVTHISGYAFEKCSNLKKVTIPNSVTNIGECAFTYCSALLSLDIPDSVTSIGYRLFRGCSSVERITVASGNSNYYSVNNCLIETATKTLVVGCKNSVIPADEGLEKIALWAFSGCSNLTEVFIPKSVTVIDSDVFADCNALDTVTFGGDIYDWCNITFGSSYSNPVFMAHKLYIDDELFTDIIIPDTITEIKSYAFQGFSQLTQIQIPNSITSIGVYSFQGCSNLERIEIPASVTSIGYRAFQGCVSATIYCEAAGRMPDWDDSWNDSNRPVIWDYKNNDNS